MQQHTALKILFLAIIPISCSALESATNYVILNEEDVSHTYLEAAKRREFLLWASHMAVGATEIGLCSAVKNYNVDLSSRSPLTPLCLSLCFLTTIPFIRPNIAYLSTYSTDTISDIVSITRKKLAYVTRFAGTNTVSTLFLGLLLGTQGYTSASMYTFLAGSSLGLALDSARPWLNYSALRQHMRTRASSSFIMNPA